MNKKNANSKMRSSLLLDVRTQANPSLLNALVGEKDSRSEQQTAHKTKKKNKGVPQKRKAGSFSSPAQG